jgi:hypothetical protein
MRELYIEGLAIHGGPESCAGVREGVGEALTGVDGDLRLLRSEDCDRRPPERARYLERSRSRVARAGPSSSAESRGWRALAATRRAAGTLPRSLADRPDRRRATRIRGRLIPRHARERPIRSKAWKESAPLEAVLPRRCRGNAHRAHFAVRVRDRRQRASSGDSQQHYLPQRSSPRRSKARGASRPSSGAPGTRSAARASRDARAGASGRELPGAHLHHPRGR